MGFLKLVDGENLCVFLDGSNINVYILLPCMRLTNKIAIITGGSAGIGRSTALFFAQEGADVVITYNKHADKAEEVVNQIKGLGRNALAVQFDAEESFDEVVKKTIQEFGRIDILVNNAGILFPTSLEEMTSEKWDKTIAVNLTGVQKCIKEVIPFMKKQKSGKIINISSVAGIVGSIMSVAYSASKAGVDAITKTLSKDFAKYNISINSVAPGPVNTDMVRDNMSTELITTLNKETPMGRIAEPEDIAKVILFFASSDSDFVTGQTLIVDGGRSVR